MWRRRLDPPAQLLLHLEEPVLVVVGPPDPVPASAVTAASVALGPLVTVAAAQ